MESLSIDMQGKSVPLTSGNTSAVLDSGTSLSILPPDATLSIAQMLNATMDYFPNFFAVDCKLRQLNATFDFAFSGVTIRVPFSHFIMPPRTANDTQCLVGMQSTAGTNVEGIEFAILGDMFLQDAYVVFDQTNMAASLAQYVNCGTHEQALPAAATALEQFIGEC